MKVIELAATRVVTIGRKGTIVEAAHLMREHHVGDVVLVDEKGSERVPVGVVTDRDIVVAAIAQGIEDPSKILVEDIAAKDLVIAEADDDVSDVARLMLAQGIRRVPVVNALGALVGIITYDDLVAWMADELADFARLFTRQRKREHQTRK